MSDTEAEAALIEAMANATISHEHRDFNRCSCGWGYGSASISFVGWTRHVQSKALAALRVVTVSQTCRECDGAGRRVPYPGEVFHDALHANGKTTIRCPDCDGGRVSRRALDIFVKPK